jgi:hypothetical protein
VPSRVFRPTVSLPDLSPDIHPLMESTSLSKLTSEEYCAIGSQSHFAVSRFFSFVVFHLHWCIPFPRRIGIPAFQSFVFLQSLAQLILAPAPQRQSSSHGLSRPYSTCQVQRFFNTAGFHVRRRLRLQGLVTLLAYSPLCTPVSFVSHSQRSWGSPFGVSSPTRRVMHLCRTPPTYCSFCP